MAVIARSISAHGTFIPLVHSSFVALTIIICGDVALHDDGESLPGRREIQGWMGLRLLLGVLPTDKRVCSLIAVDGSLGSRYKQ